MRPTARGARRRPYKSVRNRTSPPLARKKKSGQSRIRRIKNDTQRVREAGAGSRLMYGAEAQALRRCQGARADGTPCRAWAVWNDRAQRCVAHSDRPPPTRRGRGNYWPYAAPSTKPAHYEPCRCVAYGWPHRPGGGLCEWPLEPTYRRTTRAGTHSPYWSRTSRAFRAFIRQHRACERTGRLPRDHVLPPELAKYVA